MMSSSLRRQMKNMVHNYTEAEVKVREATSNDPWGPPGSLMSEISDLTFNAVAFPEVMGMVWKRLNDHGKNWRHVYKALALLDYLVKTGSERVAQQCRDNMAALQTLRDFQHVDRDGKDQGAAVREKARQLVALLRDEERLRRERGQALKTKERVAATATRGQHGYSDLPPPYPGRRTSQPVAGSHYPGEGRPRGSSSFNSSSSSPRLASDLEEARPQSSGEEELQLQLALAMSREENEKPPPAAGMDEKTQLQIALSLSKEEAQQPKPALPVSMEMDEDAQLQLALSLSKEEHQQEQRSRQGDESMLQKALEESRREMKGGGEESAMKDLEDIFGPGPVAPSSGEPWDLTAGNPCGKPATMAAADPWDSLAGDRSVSPVIDRSWMTPPPSSSLSKPWGKSPPLPDPWEAPGSTPTPNAAGRAWISPVHTGSAGVDPFSAAAEEPLAPRDAPKPTTSRSGSPTDGDLFGEPVMEGQVNGRDEDSPEPFDLSRLKESLHDPGPRTCRTPESFLDPTAASLVNLDTLIPPNPQPKTNNPFLSGLSAPSPTNPFQSDQPRLTLNQMRPSSTSPVPGSASPIPSSASLPLPLSHQPAVLPTSYTQPPPYPTSQGLLDMPPNLPQPLLPLSSAPLPGHLGDQQNQNPFL
ncbi:epsin-3 isoform X1 [Megalops cyprinoides]|uniref:epsin-3 isoform X1 n=1 Tax=Megalops cyprinoides TaxID=118141 RepID=UPI001863D893|nr:epsin-3 isoform X1 [Megalops cyprinoides]